MSGGLRAEGKTCSTLSALSPLPAAKENHAQKAALKPHKEKVLVKSVSLLKSFPAHRTRRRGVCLCCWLIFLPLFLLPTSTRPQQARFVFEHLGLEAGLSATDVRSLLQDRYGFIWIGTVDGLDMYDGYGFMHYKHKPFDARSQCHHRAL